jgi:hypothetical protein
VILLTSYGWNHLTISRSDETIDMGLVPPLLNKEVALNKTEIEQIYSCAADADEALRPYYTTYIGNFLSGPNGHRFPARQELTRREICGDTTVVDFIFIAAPPLQLPSLVYNRNRHLSPRFIELRKRSETIILIRILSIPIVVADDWMLPFRPELVDWDECIILLLEKEYRLWFCL